MNTQTEIEIISQNLRHLIDNQTTHISYDQIRLLIEPTNQFIDNKTLHQVLKKLFPLVDTIATTKQDYFDNEAHVHWCIRLKKALAPLASNLEPKI